ncbi:hypothetical protein BC628DRAFT_820457 [Trametes gibbosa]|nr:hypothetical protein BC628DRAFT_820457 [Trametes gibbosa]
MMSGASTFNGRRAVLRARSRPASLFSDSQRLPKRTGTHRGSRPARGLPIIVRGSQLARMPVSMDRGRGRAQSFLT